MSQPLPCAYDAARQSRVASEMGARVKGKALKSLLAAHEPTYMMEAHNGLSGLIVEEAGFPGIWASGLTISASLGVRDANEASWTQVLDIVEFIADAVEVPILFDGDSGFGNFNNVRRLVRKLCDRGIAGVSLEDKVFPKINSFANSEQRLAEPKEFASRIRAAKDHQTNPDFCVIARTESFIAGAGLAEALDRADCYLQAGADAILVHSKSSTADEVLAFAEAWRRRCPLVCVPTTYGATPTSDLFAAGYGTIIWANHCLRAAMTAMRQVSRQILASNSALSAESDIASVAEVLKITDMDELIGAEHHYLGAARPQ